LCPTSGAQSTALMLLRIERAGTSAEVDELQGQVQVLALNQ
jgi:hypothetical protein